MEEREKIELLNQDDYILRIDDEAFVITKLNDYLDEFMYDNIRLFYEVVNTKLQIDFSDKDPKVSDFYEEWCVKGTECKLIKPGEEWQKGKVRFTMKVEFFPDETEDEKVEGNGHQEVENITESPLDEIRQQLTQENES